MGVSHIDTAEIHGPFANEELVGRALKGRRENSLWTRDPEAELLPLLRDLGIGFVPYSALGHGFLTGTIRSPEALSDDDWRKTKPRFTEGNFEKNLRIVDQVEAVASEVDATPAQVALAWLLAHLTPASGERHDDANMAAIDR